MAAGNFVHTLALVIGLSALIVATPALAGITAGLFVLLFVYLAIRAISQEAVGFCTFGSEPMNIDKLRLLDLISSAPK